MQILGNSLIALAIFCFGEDVSRPSIEELIRLSKERSAQVRRQNEQRLGEILPLLELPYDKNETLVGEKIDELTKMGPSIWPLLLPQLNPNGQDDRMLQRGRNCARAIGKMEAKPPLEELFALLKNGTTEGKRNAIYLLGAFQIQESRESIEVFLDAKQESELRLQAIRALGKLKSDLSLPALLECLKHADHPLAREILATLDEIPSNAAIQSITQIAIEAYFRPMLSDFLVLIEKIGGRESLPYLCQALTFSDLRTNQLKALIQSIGKLGAPACPQAIAPLKTLLDHPDREIQAEAGFALNELGDDSGSKILTAAADEYIKDYPRDPRGYESRGKTWFRLKRHREAIRDFKESIRLARKDAPLAEIYVLLARSHGALNQLRDAYQALKNANLEVSALAAYKDLPELKTLRDHERYGKIFGK